MPMLLLLLFDDTAHGDDRLSNMTAVAVVDVVVVVVVW